MHFLSFARFLNVGFSLTEDFHPGAIKPSGWKSQPPLISLTALILLRIRPIVKLKRARPDSGHGESYSHGQPMSNPGWEIAGYENGKEILPGHAGTGATGDRRAVAGGQTI